MLRHLPFILLALVLAAGGGYLGYLLRAPSNGQLVGLPQSVNITAPLGGDFHLVRHDGIRVSNKNFLGQYALIYFGYSYCPDICQTSLIEMLRAYNALSPEQRNRVTPIFITVDPERDTVDELAPYVADFDPHLVGLTGSVEQIEAVKKLYKVYSKKSGDAKDIEENMYLVNHSSFFYLLDPEGSLSQMFSGQISPENFRSNLSKIIVP